MTATTKQIWYFVVVVCLALLLKDAAAKVIEELERVKSNINVFRIKGKKLSEESTWQSENETKPF